MKKFLLRFSLFFIILSNLIPANAQWVAQNSGTTNRLNDIFFINADIGYAVGASGSIRKTTNGGTAWTSQTSGTTNMLYSICFTDANTGYVVGASGKILKTNNGGTTWFTQTSGITNDLKSIFFIDSITGYAVGENGTIRKTTNGGTTWNIQTCYTQNDLKDVWFINADTGYVVGETGIIFRTSNGGIDWFLQNNGITNSLNSIYFINHNTGFVVGDFGTIWKTSDGGNTWNFQTSGTQGDLFSLHFFNDVNGYVVGAHGIILKTNNGGTSWMPQLSGTSIYFFSIFATEENTAFIASDYGNVFKTFNGGWCTGIPGEIIGSTSFCPSAGIQNYYTTEAPYANSYSWTLTPITAGSIIGNGTTASVNWDTSYNGSALVKVQGVKSGCTGESSSINVFLNNSNGNPETFLLISPSNATWISRTPTFQWSSSTGALKYILYIDGLMKKDNIIGTSYQLFPNESISSGMHTWYVVANNGCTSQSNETRSFLVDATPPSTFNLISPIDNSWTTSTQPTLSWSPSIDAQSGLAKYQLWIDNILNRDNISATASSTTPTNILSNGSHTWEIRAVDNVGNVKSSSQIWKIGIDSLPPSIDNIYDKSLYLTSNNSQYASSSISAASYQYLNGYTFEFWINKSSVFNNYLNNNYGTIIDERNNYTIFVEKVTNSTYKIHFKTSYADHTFPTILNTNHWYHITIVGAGDGSTRLKFYVDGVLCSNSLSDYSFWSNTFNYPLLIGSKYTSQGYGGFFFDGKIDEVRIWNRELTLQEIQLNIDKIIDPTCNSHLLGYWRFNNVIGTTIFDETNTANNLTIHNGGILVNKNMGLSKLTNLITPYCSEYLSSNDIMFLWNKAPDAGIGLEKYQLFIDGTLIMDNLSDTSCIISNNLTYGIHNWNIKGFDSLGIYQSSSVSIFFIDNAPPNPFNLTSPTNNEVVMFPTPNLSWQAVTDSTGGAGMKKYQLWINGVVNRDSISMNTTTVSPANVLPQGAYTWFVKAYDNVGNIRQSTETRIFYVDWEAPLPFNLISPTDNQTLVIPNPTFIWHPSHDIGSGLDRYEITISGYQPIVLLPTDTIYNLSFNLPNGNYSWFVKAFDHAGAFTSSNINSFTINVPLPEQAATPTGTNELCIGSQTTTYTTTGANYAENYVWEITPSSAGTISGTGTTGTVNWNATFSGIAQITVKGQNIVGFGLSSLPFAVTVHPATIPGTISGSSTICLGQPTGTLMLSNFSGTILKWQKRWNGGSWSDINNSNTTYFETPQTVGLHEYRAAVQNEICPPLFSTIASVTAGTVPAFAGTISGPASVCSNQYGVTYSVNPINDATYYQWTLPTGASGVSTSNSINANFSANAESGYISVSAENLCGASATVNKYVNVVDDIKMNIFTNQETEPNNILNINSGENVAFHIKVDACSNLNRKIQIQFQFYKDDVLINNLNNYLTDQYMSVSYSLDQSGVINPNNNNTYFNTISNGTFPCMNSAWYPPKDGYVANGSTFDWFYLHFFNNRFVNININSFIQTGQYKIIYKLVSASPQCNIMENPLQYYPGYEYGGLGFQDCNDLTILESDTMTINVINDNCSPCPLYDEIINIDSNWNIFSSDISSYGCKIFKIPINIDSLYLYTFKTSCGNGATNSFDTYLELYNSNCDLLSQNDDACNSVGSEIKWTNNDSITGHIYLKVRGFSGYYGTFTLAYRKEVVCLKPNQPSVISGNDQVCLKTFETYTIPEVYNATSYEWSFPEGVYGASTSNSIVLFYDTISSSGYVSVKAINSCGLSDESLISINYNESSSSIINETVCDTYTAPDGQVYTTSGIKTANILNAAGCDSTITINLIVNQSTSSTINETVCDTYTAPDGQVYTTSGTNTAVIPNTAGCDSTITINLTVNQSSSSTINETVCNSYTAPDGQLYTTSGTKTSIIPNFVGCDSTITINLIVNQSTSSTINETVCDTYTAPDGQVYTTSGTNTAVIPNTAGCDSTITINLTVNQSSSSTITDIVCNSYTAPDGQVYTTSGIKTAIIPNFAACDSLITIYLTVNPLPADAGIITGNATVCQGETSVTYTVPTINYATSYVWTKPNGVTGTSSTNSITFNYGTTAVSGNITVKGTNSCGDGVVSTKSITVNPLPAAAGTISGSSTVCQGQNSVTYTVPSISNATSYVWTLPNGSTGTSTTNSITVSYGTTAISGNITVKGTNSCGDGVESTKVITVNPLPSVAGTISGNAIVCQGQNSVTYTVPSITNATSYVWTLPTGATGNSSTNSITVNYGTSAISGNITVKGSNSCGDGVESILAVTVNPLPADAGTITGNATVCQGETSVTYTVPTVNYATSYVWTKPNGVTGTSSTNSITFNYGTTAVSGNITVKGTNSCGDGVVSTKAITVNPLPANAGTISGNATVCQGQNAVTYTVPNIANATSYLWTLPNGAIGTSTTNSITVDFNTSATSGNITVKGTNACGDGVVSTKAITVNPLPIAAGSITGNATVCQGQNSVIYTVPSITNATSYVWTLPNGATGTSTTNSITVSYGTTAISGNITVKGSNSCGDGVESTKVITVSPLPDAAGTITGNATICQGENLVNYSVPDIANATSYIWTLPSGATGTSTTNSIIVNYGTTVVSGNITVKGTNACGDGILSTKAINVNPLPSAAGTISGSVNVCQGQNGVTYTVPNITNATSYVWTLPNGATGNSTTNSISVDYSVSSESGNITVKGVNACGDGTTSTKAITVHPLPDAAGIISGNATVCQGENSVVYLIPSITNAISYIWTLPNGATGTSTTNSISVNYGTTAISGNISVKGSNDCGEGDISTKAITVKNRSTNTLTETACETYTAPDGQVYTTSGTKTAIIPNAVGCDSVITINLTVNYSPVTPSIVLDFDKLISSSEFGNQWFNQNGMIPNETNQELVLTENGTYYVIVTQNDCSSDPSNSIIVNNVLVQKFDKNLIVISPNPFTNQLTIKNQTSETYQYTMYNGVGQILFKGTLESEVMLNTSDLSTGLYIIKFVNSLGQMYYKVVKQ